MYGDVDLMRARIIDKCRGADVLSRINIYDARKNAKELRRFCYEEMYRDAQIQLRLIATAVRGKISPLIPIYVYTRKFIKSRGIFKKSRLILTRFVIKLNARY